MRKDIYNFDKIVKRTKEALAESSISDRNKELIEEFCDDKANGFFGSKVGKQRTVKLMSFIKNICLQIKKDLDTLTEKDVKQFIMGLNQNEDYSEWTRSDYKKILKQLINWLNHKKYLTLDVDFIKTTADKKLINKLKREDFLEMDEIRKMLDASQNLRDRCLIHMAWDLGARIGELGNIKIKDLIFDEEGGAEVHLKGKTGERCPYIIESIPTITQWLSIHPHRDDENSPLFCSLGRSKDNKEVMAYRTIYKILEVIVKKAGIKKSWNPHLFRHSRALWAAVNNWNNQMANAFFGWNDESTMFSYYIKLGKQDLKQHMKQMYDKEAITEKKQNTERIKCKCGKLNDPEASYCWKCGNILSMKTALKKHQSSTNKDIIMDQMTGMLINLIDEKAKKNPNDPTVKFFNEYIRPPKPKPDKDGWTRVW